MYSGSVVDCDVHHDWPTPEALYPYLSSGWREFVMAPTRVGLPAVPLVPTQMCPNPAGNTCRPDAFPGDGRNAGSDLPLMREQLLDPMNVERAVLDYGAGMFIGAHPHPHFATAVARAANDWTIDTWLSGQDDRLYGAVAVATQIPEEAAAEIRRVGGHPRMCEVVLVASGLGKTFGHPAYHPIYEAAVEMDLPVAIHVGGEATPLQGMSVMGSGMPSYYFEVHTQSAQGVMSHTMSLIVNGVFEKYPSLRVLLVESTLAWVPWLLWSMDAGYKGIRRETPWLKRHPSEYFYDHFRMTTQPLDSSPDDQQLVELLKMFNGEDMLCFSSDYPHWDGDERDHVARRLPASWLPKVFRENAWKWYGWADSPSDRSLETAAAAHGGPAAETEA
jgi:predicted TIM-barrel fold metal-dependent hydrolase